MNPSVVNQIFQKAVTYDRGDAKRIQHFIKDNGYGADLENIQKRDAFKNAWTKEKNIPLIRIPYTHYDDLCLEDLLLETSSFII